jgi:hypothetical protein
MEKNTRVEKKQTSITCSSQAGHYAGSKDPAE